MPQWQKPENALRRANELLEVGKKQDALDTLHDVIKARKHRTWTKVHEQIMTKHLELCVELRKPHLAKDGLFQYRNMCQQVNVKSLEDVMMVFLDEAEKKADQARQASQGMVEDVAEDLDQAETPERLLLSAVSGEGDQERADRSVLSPWLRFLWESYRQCLELLRNNVQVEQLYHKVAKYAFQFCLKYQRRAEFRKLCDNLRTHLNQLQKSHMHYAIKLTNPETLALHQETRLKQLDVAIQMELWQEAYKSAEDVHQLMQSAKRSAKPHTLASYYERLALVFWKAGNTLYHTAALLKLFQLHKDMKKSFSAEEATHLATRVLLATLSVRWSDQVHDLARHLEMEETHLEHQRRLASLLSWPSPPTRQSLLKELQRINVVSLALPPAQRLYQWLECEFSPLKMASEVHRSLEMVQKYEKPEYSQYIDALQQVAALKILKQISQVYRSISLQRFLAIVPFFDICRLERLIVAAGRKAQIQVRIDHRTGSVEFGVGEALTFSSKDDESTVGTGSQLDVPIIQSMPSEHIRQYLQQMYVVLQEAVDSVDKEAADAVMEKLKNNAKYFEYHKGDHQKHILERKKRIEAYKETLERIKTEQEEMVKMQEKLEMEKRQKEDQQRLMQEKQERTAAQLRREQEEMTRRVMQDRIEKMKDPNFRRLIKDLPEEEIQNLDAETLLQKQISHLEKEKREQVEKLKQQEKKWDYYVRAIHQEEIPSRETEYKEKAVLDRQLWDQHELDRVEREEEEHVVKLSNHNRLIRMETDADSYLKTIREARAAEMKRRMEEWKRMLEETRERRLQERKDERKEKRRQDWLQAKEIEKQKKEEEERRKKEAEEQGRRGPGGRFDQGDRRRQGRGDDEEGGEPRGADADTWERTGPLRDPQRDQQPRKAPFEEGGGRRFGAPRAPADENEGESGADAGPWRQGVQVPGPPEHEREPVRRAGLEDEGRRGDKWERVRRFGAGGPDEPEGESGADSAQWRRGPAPVEHEPMPLPLLNETRRQPAFEEGPVRRYAAPRAPANENEGESAADARPWRQGAPLPPVPMEREPMRRGFDDGGRRGDRWERVGPVQNEPRRRPGFDDGRGRRFGAGGPEEPEGESGADTAQWRRGPAPVEREPMRRHDDGARRGDRW